MIEQWQLLHVPLNIKMECAQVAGQVVLHPGKIVYCQLAKQLFQTKNVP